MFRVVLIAAVAFAAIVTVPSDARAAKFERSGLAWRLVLENSEVQDLKKGAALATLVANPEPAVSKAVAAAIGMIDLVNEIGGRRGVEITGVISYSATTITPKGNGPYGELVKAGKEISKLGEHWGGIANGNIEKASDWLAESDPGPAIANALGIGRRKKKNRHTPGGMVADRKEAGKSERFTLVQVDDGKVAILGHTGYLAAEGGGGGATYANRDKIGDWEKWTVVRNSDGTVSFGAHDGRHYFVAEEGGGSVCGANRTAIGDWEKFRLEYDDNGGVAIKTLSKGLYVSSQP